MAEDEKGDGQTLAVVVAAPSCWAYSKQRQRCEMPGGHLGPHGVTYSWEDWECFDPAVDSLVTFVDKPVPFVPTPLGTGERLPPAEQVLAEEEALLRDLGAVPNGECFSCGCLEDDHPCEQHGCRTFVA